jgi:hypothetical protein
VEGSELGPLQLAMWTAQFAALRDGDRFFYANDGVLNAIEHAFGIDFRRTLAQVIADNTELDACDLAPNVFVAADDQAVGSGPRDEKETVAAEAAPNQRVGRPS